MHRKGKDGISEMFTLVQLSIPIFFDYFFEVIDCF